MADPDLYAQALDIMDRVDPEGRRLKILKTSKGRFSVHPAVAGSSGFNHAPLLEYNETQKELLVWSHAKDNYVWVPMGKFEQAIVDLNDYYLDPLERLADV